MRYSFKDLFQKYKLTGFSTPFGGITYEVAEGEKEIIEKFITFLEGRRALFSELYEGCPEGVIDSIMTIRNELQKVREELNRNSYCFKILSKMQDRIFEFIQYACKDCPNPHSCKNCQIYEEGCIEGLLEFRKRFGTHIADIAVTYKINIDHNLKVIIPIHDENSQSYGDARR